MLEKEIPRLKLLGICSWLSKITKSVNGKRTFRYKQLQIWDYGKTNICKIYMRYFRLNVLLGSHLIYNGLEIYRKCNIFNNPNHIPTHILEQWFVGCWMSQEFKEILITIHRWWYKNMPQDNVINTYYSLLMLELMDNPRPQNP